MYGAKKGLTGLGELWFPDGALFRVLAGPLVGVISLVVMMCVLSHDGLLSGAHGKFLPVLRARWPGLAPACSVGNALKQRRQGLVLTRR